MNESKRYPVLVMSGRDEKRRDVMRQLDPDGRIDVKALLPFRGRRVIEWQLEALSASPFVEGLYLLGIREGEIAPSIPAEFLPVNRTDPFEKKLATGLGYLRHQGKGNGLIVVSSSDAPAIRTSAVNEFLSRLSGLPDYDFVLSLVPEDIAEAAFPKTRRVVARFNDCAVFPGELYALSPRAIEIGQEVIRELHRRRRLIDRHRDRISLGPLLRLLARHPAVWFLLLKYLLGRARLADAERAFALAFNCKAKGVIVPDATFGMDIDLPGDLERLEAYVDERDG